MYRIEKHLTGWKTSLLEINISLLFHLLNHCTIDLLFDWFGISCMATDNFCFYLQNRLVQTSQTGGQWYSDTSPFSIPWLNHCWFLKFNNHFGKDVIANRRAKSRHQCRTTSVLSFHRRLIYTGVEKTNNID